MHYLHNKVFVALSFYITKFPDKFYVNDGILHVTQTSHARKGTQTVNYIDRRYKLQLVLLRRKSK